MRRKQRPVKLFLDESVPKIVKEAFLRPGVSLVDVSELGLSGADDETVFNISQKQGRIFVTVDLKFVTRIFLSKNRHCGVILLKYKGRISKELLAVLTEFVRKYYKKDLKNTLIVIDREKFRVRKI